MAIATFAAGCFWGVEATFRHIDGVTSTAVGYMGGVVKNPTYEQVCTGTTSHAEVVQLQFDEQTISYQQLLALFWQCHNPTTLNRQGADKGTQYRSVIFYHDAQQQADAELSKQQLSESGQYQHAIVTEITAADIFYQAEEYHQNYFEKNGITHCPISQ